MTELKDNLKHIRKRRGLTQNDLAIKINVTPQVISNIERGYTKTSHIIIKRLTDALACSVGDLVGGNETSVDYEMIVFNDKATFDALPEEEKNRILDQLQEQADFLVERAKKNI